MRHKLVMDQSEMPTPKWITNMGGFNHLPEPFALCEAKDFWFMFQIWSPEAIEFRQVYLDHTTPEGIKQQMHNTQIYWFYNTAFALLRFNNEDAPRFFRLGCNHTYEELSQDQSRREGITHHGRSYHVYRCSKCSYVKSEDSSD